MRSGGLVSSSTLFLLCCRGGTNGCMTLSLCCSLGGVVVTSTDGRIVVNNTLDTRLRIVEEQQLPAIREMLFGNE